MRSCKSSNNLPRRIALVDCNNFYASCERVFHPAWEHRPVGVLSNNDGCIIARSNELKEAGIPMGAPFFKYRDQLRAMKAVIVSSNYTLYGDMSARVMNTLNQFTPDMEIYSIDEAWLNLTGFDPATLDSYARQIVATTHKNTGIPVSMGIGQTRVLAKIANRICKKRKIPGQVFNLGDATNLGAVLSGVPVGDIWGIGCRWAEKLQSHGIYTAYDLQQSDPSYMRDRYNVVMQRLIMELRGVECLGFEDIEPKKEIIASRSFGERVTDKQSLLEAVALHATRAGEKLRLQYSACKVLQVAIRTSKHSPNEPFFGRSAMIHFPVATSDTRKLIALVSSVYINRGRVMPKRE
jgi:DNA polymerase V